MAEIKKSEIKMSVAPSEQTLDPPAPQLPTRPPTAADTREAVLKITQSLPASLTNPLTQDQLLQLKQLSQAVQSEILSARYQGLVQKSFGGERGLNQADQLLALEKDCRNCLRKIEAIAPTAVDRTALKSNLKEVSAAANEFIEKQVKESSAKEDGTLLSIAKAVPRTIETAVDLTVGNLAYYGGGVVGFVAGKGWQWSEAGAAVINFNRKLLNNHLGGSALGSDEEFGRSKLYQDFFAANPLGQAAKPMSIALKGIEKSYDGYQRWVWNAGETEKLSPEEFSKVRENNSLLKLGTHSIQAAEAATGLAMAAATGGASAAAQMSAAGRALGVAGGFSAVGAGAQEIYQANEINGRFELGRLVKNTLSGTAQSTIFMGALGQVVKQGSALALAEDYRKIQQLRRVGEFDQAREVIAGMRVTKASLGVASKSVDVGDGVSDMGDTAAMAAAAKNRWQLFASALQAGVNVVDTGDVSLSGTLDFASGRNRGAKANQAAEFSAEQSAELSRRNSAGLAPATISVSEGRAVEFEIPISSSAGSDLKQARIPATFNIGRMTAKTSQAVSLEGLPDGTIETRSYSGAGTAGVSIAKISDQLFTALVGRALAATGRNPELASDVTAFAYRGGIPGIDQILPSGTVVVRDSLSRAEAGPKVAHELAHLLNNQGEEGARAIELRFRQQTGAGPMPAPDPKFYSPEDLASGGQQSFAASYDPRTRDKFLADMAAKAATLSADDRRNLVYRTLEHSIEDGLDLGRQAGLTADQLLVGLGRPECFKKHQEAIKKLHLRLVVESKYIDPVNLPGLKAGQDAIENATRGRAAEMPLKYLDPSAASAATEIDKYYAQYLTTRTLVPSSKPNSDTPGMMAGNWLVDMVSRGYARHVYTGPFVDYFSKKISEKYPGEPVAEFVDPDQNQKAIQRVLQYAQRAQSSPDPKAVLPTAEENDAVDFASKHGAAILRQSPTAPGYQVRNLAKLLNVADDPEFSALMRDSRWTPTELTLGALQSGAEDRLIAEVSTSLVQRGKAALTVSYNATTDSYELTGPGTDPARGGRAEKIPGVGKLFEEGRARVLLGGDKPEIVVHEQNITVIDSAGAVREGLYYLRTVKDTVVVENHGHEKVLIVNGNPITSGPNISDLKHLGEDGWMCIVKTDAVNTAIVTSNHPTPHDFFDRISEIYDMGGIPAVIGSGPNSKVLMVNGSIVASAPSFHYLTPIPSGIAFAAKNSDGTWTSHEFKVVGGNIEHLEHTEPHPIIDVRTTNGQAVFTFEVQSNHLIRTGDSQLLIDGSDDKAVGPNGIIASFRSVGNNQFQYVDSQGKLGGIYESPRAIGFYQGKSIFIATPPGGTPGLYIDEQRRGEVEPDSRLYATQRHYLVHSFSNPRVIEADGRIVFGSGDANNFDIDGDNIYHRHLRQDGDYDVHCNGYPFAVVKSSPTPYLASVRGHTVLQGVGPDGVPVIYVDQQRVGQQAQNVIRTTSDSRSGKIAIVTREPGQNDVVIWSAALAEEPTPYERQRIDLLNVVHNPTRENIDGYKANLPPPTQPAKTRLQQLADRLQGSIKFAQQITDAMHHEPEPFLDSLTAKPFPRTDYALNAAVAQLYPEVPGNRVHQSDQERFGSIGGWFRSIGRAIGIGDPRPQVDHDQQSRALLTPRDATSLASGDPVALAKRPKTIVELRSPQSGFFVTGLFNNFDSKTGNWSAGPISTAPITGSVEEQTAVIPSPPPGAVLTLPVRMGSQIVPERVKAVMSDGNEQHLEAQRRPDGGGLVTVPSGAKQILYSYSTPSVDPVPADVSNAQYQAFLRETIRTQGPGIAGRVEGIPAEARAFVGSIADLHPKERLAAIEQYVRDRTYYDFDEGQISSVKRDLPAKELFGVMAARADELRRTRPDLAKQLDGRIYAGVCADCARLTAAMLRESGFAAGVAEGLRADSSRKLTTGDAHGIAFVQWPAPGSERGGPGSRSMLIPVDGTPAGERPGLGLGMSAPQLPSLAEKEKEVKAATEKRRTETGAELEKVERILRSKDSKAISELTNGKLETVVNAALTLTSDTQLAVFQSVFDFARYGRGDSMATDADRVALQQQIAKQAEAVRIEASKHPQGQRGGECLALFTEYLRRYERDSGSRQQALDTLARVFNLAQPALDPVEHRTAVAVIAYLQSRSIRGGGR